MNLRHLGIANTLELIDILLKYLKERSTPVGNVSPRFVSEAYVYDSSADNSVLSLNFESPGEKDVFLNVSIPRKLFATPKDLQSRTKELDFILGHVHNS